MLIQVDVDNTLYPSDECFQRVAKEYAVDWPLTYDHWFGPEEVDLTLPELLKIFEISHSDPNVAPNKPYDHAAEVLAEIVDARDDIEIAYVSDRNEETGPPLRRWLQAHGFLHSEDQHVVVSSDKRAWMRANRPDAVLDDRVRTMIMARFELDAQVASLEHPYNINLRGEVDGIYLVPDWLAMRDVIFDTILPAIDEKRRRQEINDRRKVTA